VKKAAEGRKLSVIFHLGKVWPAQQETNVVILREVQEEFRKKARADTESGNRRYSQGDISHPCHLNQRRGRTKRTAWKNRKVLPNLNLNARVNIVKQGRGAERITWTTGASWIPSEGAKEIA